MGKYYEDKFTETDVLRELDLAGLTYRNGSRYITSQCPTHEDVHPSVQIYKDDWFVNCHAGCGRYHITKAFPGLTQEGEGDHNINPRRPKPVSSGVPKVKYKQFNLMKEWKNKNIINDEFKTIPPEVLFDMGWRLERNGDYFIPYFNMDKSQIPFAQYRHFSGDRRFSMLKDARPIAYGLWNLDNPKLFVVEGTSDCAVLQYAAVPYVGMPSASSSELAKGLGDYCKKNAIQLVYAGDNDSAGDKLREALDEVVSYRVCQPPKKYKDWGDFLEAEGIDAVRSWTDKEMNPPVIDVKPKNHLEAVQKVFPGAKELKMVGSRDFKEQSNEPTPLF